MSKMRSPAVGGKDPKDGTTIIADDQEIGPRVETRLGKEGTESKAILGGAVDEPPFGT